MKPLKCNITPCLELINFIASASGSLSSTATINPLNSTQTDLINHCQDEVEEGLFLPPTHVPMLTIIALFD